MALTNSESAPIKTTEPASKKKKTRKYTITAIVGAAILAASVIFNLPPPFFLTGATVLIAATAFWIRTNPKRREIEMSPRMRKMNRIAKLATLSGELVAAASFILLLLGGGVLGRVLTNPEPNAPDVFPVLRENLLILWNVFFVGVLIAIAFAVVQKMMKVEEEIVKPTKAELYIRNILGILLILLAFAPLILSIVVVGGIGPPVVLIPLVLPFGLLMGIYLLRSKRYRLAVDIFWVLLGVWKYTTLAPILGYPPPIMLKGLLLASDWSRIDPLLLIFSIEKILFLGTAIFLFVGDMLVSSRSFAKSTKRGLINVVTLLTIMLAVLGVPLL